MKEIMSVAAFDVRRIANALTVEAYEAQWAARLEETMEGLDLTGRRYLMYARYNFERARRVYEEYRMSDALRAGVAAVAAPQYWLVLTEDWCGDSAFSLPIMAVAARSTPMITLRILLRDQNLDVMDRFLTAGGRSIPKLIVFEEHGSELFRWGPRPREAQAYRERLRAEGTSGPALSRSIITWYEEGGWQLVDEELSVLLSGFDRTD